MEGNVEISMETTPASAPHRMLGSSASYVCSKTTHHFKVLYQIPVSSCRLLALEKRFKPFQKQQIFTDLPKLKKIPFGSCIYYNLILLLLMFLNVKYQIMHLTFVSTTIAVNKEVALLIN